MSITPSLHLSFAFRTFSTSSSRYLAPTTPLIFFSTLPCPLAFSPATLLLHLFSCLTFSPPPSLLLPLSRLIVAGQEQHQRQVPEVDPRAGAALVLIRGTGILRDPVGVRTVRSVNTTSLVDHSRKRSGRGEVIVSSSSSVCLLLSSSHPPS